MMSIIIENESNVLLVKIHVNILWTDILTQSHRH